jgi:hypothetical protein
MPAICFAPDLLQPQASGLERMSRYDRACASHSGRRKIHPEGGVAP